ncbi:sensor histidine kinase [Sunxiuqinia dokdonensis]|uniref:histidine kinase n=1 Tax=Sunxiuqinia dokdonensis TaxID=1409788 RepID=A0A0L8VB36_9BACT|nr:HAMP domain-containing sensor histidine kinase [Sunxiuqinia dokdonensis]KOH45644.1 histidine kinase [Sunxiuqinia dokdonensis]
MKRFFALKIAIAYFILGFLWILTSDHILVFIVSGDVGLLTKLQNYKGWFYIAVTAALLYLLIRGELKRRNKLAEDLRKAKMKAEESDRLKTAFLSNLSHEIRTPLNGLMGFANLIGEDQTSIDERKLYARHINLNGKQLLKIINDIMEISRIQENQLEINIQQVEINQLIDNLIKAYTISKKPFERKGLELKILNDLDSEPVYLESDPARIMQVLVNLMDNALKYTEKGWIAIGYEFDKQEVQISIEDTGPGIDTSGERNIFERFKQSAGFKDTGAGFGMGLAISKGIVEALNGQLLVHSKPGKGSRFTVKLPRNRSLPK